MSILKIFEDNFIWNAADKIGIAAALITMVFSILIWWRQKRKHLHDNDLIHIRLRVNDSGLTATLNGKIRRKNLTRAEVLGLLGMLPVRSVPGVGRPRYTLENLSHLVFFEALEAAQVKHEVFEVIIPCTQAELAQFDPDKLREVCQVEAGTAS